MSTDRRRSLWTAGLALGGILLLALGPVGLPGFWVFFLCLVGINAILTMSLNLAMGVTGLVSMVHTGLYAAGAYLSALLVTRLGMSAWAAMPVASLGTAALGAVVSLATLRTSHLYFAMITMAFNLILQEIAQEWDGMTGGVVGLFGVPRPSWFAGALDTRGYYYLVSGAVILTALAIRQLLRSRYGRAFRAVKLREEAAAAIGVAPLATRALSFSISAALAGLAGALFVHLNGFISPAAAGLEGSLVLFVALLLGGSGTLAGPLLGVVFVSAVQKLIQPWAQYQQFIFGIVLLLTMFLLPRGLLGTLHVWRDRATVRRPAPAPEGAGTAPGVPAVAIGAATTTMAIAAQGIRKMYGGLAALRGVDLHVRAGTVHGLIGPNGSGKSTLVGILTAHLRPDTGTVHLFDQPGMQAAHRVARSGVARVFQRPHLFAEMTVLENVMTGFQIHARERLWEVLLNLPRFRAEEARLRRRSLDLLRWGGLAEIAELRAAALPHGQLRLVEILRAVALRPRLLVLDEPATGLSGSEQERVAQLLRALQAAGVTILLIEHNMPFVMGLCDRVTVLEEGAVLAEGTPAEIQRHPEVIAAYLGARQPSEVASHA
jgi:branched-chain amino acid transport system permease protein